MGVDAGRQIAVEAHLPLEGPLGATDGPELGVGGLALQHHAARGLAGGIGVEHQPPGGGDEAAAGSDHLLFEAAHRHPELLAQPAGLGPPQAFGHGRRIEGIAHGRGASIRASLMESPQRGNGRRPRASRRAGARRAGGSVKRVAMAW